MVWKLFADGLNQLVRHVEPDGFDMLTEEPGVRLVSEWTMLRGFDVSLQRGLYLAFEKIAVT
jgi:hypothetical protein